MLNLNKQYCKLLTLFQLIEYFSYLNMNCHKFTHVTVWYDDQRFITKFEIAELEFNVQFDKITFEELKKIVNTGSHTKKFKGFTLHIKSDYPNRGSKKVLRPQFNVRDQAIEFPIETVPTQVFRYGGDRYGGDTDITERFLFHPAIRTGFMLGLPEYDLILFDNQQFLHQLTPKYATIEGAGIEEVPYLFLHIPREKRIKTYKCTSDEMKSIFNPHCVYSFLEDMHVEDVIIECQNGFHSCLYPRFCDKFYDFKKRGIKFFEVQCWGLVEYSNEKLCSSSLRLTRQFQRKEWYDLCQGMYINHVSFIDYIDYIKFNPLTEDPKYKTDLARFYSPIESVISVRDVILDNKKDMKDLDPHLFSLFNGFNVIYYEI